MENKRRAARKRKVIEKRTENRLLASDILLAISIYMLLIYIGARHGLALLPGKPTIYYASLDYGFPSYLPLISGFLAGIGLFLAGSPLLSAVSLLVSIITLYNNVFSVLLLVLLLGAILILSHEKPLRVFPALVFLSSLTIVFSRLTPSIGALGWSSLTLLLLTGVALGFGSSVAIILQRSREARRKYSRGGGEKPWLGALLLIIAVLVASLSIIIPHHRVQGGAVSLDTRYNYMMYTMIEDEGLLAATARWQRPLYSIIMYEVIQKTHIDPIFFFDFIVPLAGLFLLAISVWDLMGKTGIGYTGRGLASLLSILYWAPMFVYAGYQTNLLSIPSALYLLYHTDQYLSGRGGRTRILAISLLSLFLGLWHPWTLAYYTFASALILINRIIEGNSIGDAPIAMAVKAAILYLPGWAAHLIVALLSGRSGVVSVAMHLSGGRTLLWSLKFFQWGTALRGDIVLPVALLLYLMVVAGRKPGNSVWLIGASMPFFFGILIRNGSVFLRLMVDAPLAMLIVSLYPRKNRNIFRDAPISLLLLAALTVWAYYIMLAPLTSHPVI